jgi:general secretion pathway protein I
LYRELRFRAGSAADRGGGISSNHRGASAGFTIIEVLIALALVAMSLSAIGSLVAGNVRGTRSIEQHLALVETTRLVAASLPPRARLAPGRLSGEILGHRWRVDVSPFEAGGAPAVTSPWIPENVLLRVQSPSGAVIRVETIRLQKRATE